MLIRFLLTVFSVGMFFACVNADHKNTQTSGKTTENKIFTKLESKTTGITFKNQLVENDTLNYFTYPYIYMGGGVSAGDINNDGLTDLFFTGNTVTNKLYLNHGDLVFKDITLESGMGGDQRWYTGTTMADVNGDGLLDIYCLVAGQSGNKQNQLFINQGDNTFKEMAVDFGLNDAGNSVDATFFDFDQDGDLDVYVANYPITPFEYNSFHYKMRMDRVTDLETDNLYRNDGGHFTKITESSGVKLYSLSLSVTASDLNEDGWTDLYVSNDFGTPDCLYINQKDGTFKDEIKNATAHTSFYGMGVDIADFNNDGFLDIVQMDMDAASNRRSKANMASMNPELFANIERVGFQYQYMQNTLQMNTGFEHQGIPKFKDISRLAGISSTDWSWAPLLADFDNDGYKDLFVSNGTRREINNKDYFENLKGEKKHKDSLLDKSLRIPSEPIDNYVFKNNGNLTFSKSNKEWGIEDKGFSNGAVYADLDNDGDLELVTNNIDSEVSIFENHSSDTSNHITLSLKGESKNQYGLGAKVHLYHDKTHQVQEVTLSRGFQSSVAPKLHFGLGKDEVVDSLIVIWPNQKIQKLTEVGANSSLVLDFEEAKNTIDGRMASKGNHLFQSNPDTLALYKHKENTYDDFKNEILLPHKTSQFGPGLAVGDLNGDGLEDFYIGAASKYPGGMFFQKPDGSFEQQKLKILLEDRNHEDIGSHIFDADNDGDNDLYIVSGGNEFGPNSPMLQDRLYINQGNGSFSKSTNALPKIFISGSRVYACDFDKDGDQDLFIGGRLMPGNYPYPASSYILENISTSGFPKFINVTQKIAPEFDRLGLVTSAQWLDFDNDGWKDLAITGEWMKVRLFKNTGTTFKEITEEVGLSNTTGWWFSLKADDIDNDGDMDLVAGNLGDNYKYKANGNETFDVFLNDFDGNRTNDIVLSYYNEGEQYPVRGRECSSQQIPSIKEKFKNYDAFSKATLLDVYEEKKLEGSIHYKVSSFKSAVFVNENGKFIRNDLPIRAQIAPANQILIADFDLDGTKDIVLGGNLYASEVETPRADAGHGIFLKGTENKDFQALAPKETGLYMDGDVKDLSVISIKGKQYILIAKNNDFLKFIAVENKVAF